MSPRIWIVPLLLILMVSDAIAKLPSPDAALEAAGTGNLSALKQYQSKNGNLDAQNKQGLTPLMQAAATGQKKVVDFLLQHKADLELQNKNGDTALVMALANDQDAIAVQLIKAGAKTTVLGGENKNNLVFMAASTNCDQALKLLVQKNPELVNAQNQKGDSALHEAARFGSEKTLYILLAAGARKDLKNNEGKTPPDLAKALQNEAALKLLNSKK